MNIPLYLEPFSNETSSRINAYKNGYDTTWFGALCSARNNSGEYNKFRFILQFEHDTCESVLLEDFRIKCICNQEIGQVCFRKVGQFVRHVELIALI